MVQPHGQPSKGERVQTNSSSVRRFLIRLVGPARGGMPLREIVALSYSAPNTVRFHEVGLLYAGSNIGDQQLDMDGDAQSIGVDHPCCD